MSDVVFILGAGASRDCGGPLMSDFLDTARRLYATGDFAGIGNAAIHKEHFGRVFKAIGELQRVHSKAALDLHNIESIFAAIEMAETIGKLPGTDREHIRPTLDSLKHLIVTTLEASIEFEAKGGRIRAPVIYRRFAEVLRHIMRDAVPKRSVAVISFNYDLALDLAMYEAKLTVDYEIDRMGPWNPPVPVLKLHGSLNWGVAESGEAISVLGLHDYLAKMNFNPFEDGVCRLAVGSSLQDHFRRHRPDMPIKPQPLIVPPTWNKAEYHRQLGRVWQAAARHLGEARDIYVLGFSLPDTDQFFKLLYALGSVGHDLLERFEVYDPDPTGQVKARFNALLGAAAIARFNCAPFKFTAGLSEIMKHYPARPTS